MVAHLLYSDKDIVNSHIKIPYPTPKKVEYFEPEPVTLVKDELFDDAWRLVSESGKASTSYLQRRLGIGYNKAAKIMDQLAGEGILDEPDGAKPRQVLKYFQEQPKK